MCGFEIHWLMTGHARSLAWEPRSIPLAAARGVAAAGPSGAFYPTCRAFLALRVSRRQS